MTDRKIKAAPLSCLTDDDLEAYHDPTRRAKWLVEKMTFFCLEGLKTGASKEVVASQIELLISLAEFAKINPDA